MSRDLKYIGMDVHKEAMVIAVLNSSGKLVMESIVETKASSILQFIHGLRRGRKIAKVAMARRLAVALYWMWRKGWDYEQLQKFGSHAGQPGTRHGVQ